MKVVILIPTYNEIENIEKLLQGLTRLVNELGKYQIKILIVDSNSPDGTAQVIKKYQRKTRKVILLSDKKEGLGKSMIRGYLYAIEHLGADVVVTDEADFAYDINKHLPYMLGKINEGFDLVLASRHVGIGKSRGWTINRRVNHWVANTLFARWVAGITQVYDHNGAFRAVRVKGVLDKIGLEKMGVRGFAFFFYSLYKIIQVTDKIDEFPAVYRFRKKGESKVSFNVKYLETYLRDVAEYIKLAFKIRREKCMI